MSEDFKQKQILILENKILKLLDSLFQVKQIKSHKKTFTNQLQNARENKIEKVI